MSASTHRNSSRKTKQPTKPQATTKKSSADRKPKSVAVENAAQEETIGDRIDALLTEKQMSQRALAKQVGISQQSVFYLIHGRSGVAPQSRHVTSIANAL